MNLTSTSKLPLERLFIVISWSDHFYLERHLAAELVTNPVVVNSARWKSILKYDIKYIHYEEFNFNFSLTCI